MINKCEVNLHGTMDGIDHEKGTDHAPIIIDQSSASESSDKLVSYLIHNGSLNSTKIIRKYLILKAIRQGHTRIFVYQKLVTYQTIEEGID